jgi:hypothetical protein
MRRDKADPKPKPLQAKLRLENAMAEVENLSAAAELMRAILRAQARTRAERLAKEAKHDAV